MFHQKFFAGDGIQKKNMLRSFLYGLFIGTVYALTAFNTAIFLLAHLAGMEYRLINRFRWLVCVGVLLAAALLFVFIGKKRARPFAGVLVLYTCSAFLLFVGASGLGEKELVLIAVDYILAAALQSRCGKGVKKRLLQALAVLTAIPLLIFFGLTAVTSGDSTAETIMRYPSLDGEYMAYVRIVDEGALGGAAEVMLCRPEEVIRLGFAGVCRPVEIYTMDWMEPSELKFEWVNAGEYRINGQTRRINTEF